MKLFKQPCRFVAGAADTASLPKSAQPEIAFIGRSNCGKSSLINALVGQKTLVRTSQKPGRTQQINFFLLADKLMLVDMPGYGFAAVSKKQKNQWNRLITNYLAYRHNLMRICVLADARRGLMESDHEVMALLDEMATPYNMVLTKTDLIKPDALRELLQSVQEKLQYHAAALPDIYATSSKNSKTLAPLQHCLAAFA
ncbi:MAG: ribosome biogenesis GTP-binding protein YihA/YsxC [Alphaproteobacteria bacterium]